jgi:transcriptional regulator with XRE-family HTH domain
MTVNSWADAASAEGLAHSTVFRYYNGEVSPRIDTLQKLASPLGLKAEDLPN